MQCVALHTQTWLGAFNDLDTRSSISVESRTDDCKYDLRSKTPPIACSGSVLRRCGFTGLTGFYKFVLFHLQSEWLKQPEAPAQTIRMVPRPIWQAAPHEIFFLPSNKSYKLFFLRLFKVLFGCFTYKHQRFQLFAGISFTWKEKHWHHYIRVVKRLILLCSINC